MSSPRLPLNLLSSIILALALSGCLKGVPYGIAVPARGVYPSGSLNGEPTQIVGWKFYF
jgi:hypothetical protein